MAQRRDSAFCQRGREFEGTITMLSIVDHQLPGSSLCESGGGAVVLSNRAMGIAVSTQTLGTCKDGRRQCVLCKDAVSGGNGAPSQKAIHPWGELRRKLFPEAEVPEDWVRWSEIVGLVAALQNPGLASAEIVLCETHMTECEKAWATSRQLLQGSSLECKTARTLLLVAEGFSSRDDTGDAVSTDDAGHGRNFISSRTKVADLI